MQEEASLLPVPESMRRLRVFAGLPVPWYAEWRDDKPVYGVPVSDEKFKRAAVSHVCIMCGARLRRRAAFVGDAAVAIRQRTAVPPAHSDCAHWALGHLRVISTATHFHRVKVLWVTRIWKWLGARIFDIGVPEAVEWYLEGRSATRAEVDPTLDREVYELACSAWPGGLEDLRRRRDKLKRWLPAR
jgi:hypothetical protein